MDQTFSASGSVLATDTETKTFDPVTGGVTSITTPSGTINYAYDPATGNHVETWTDSNQTLYGYNALGQLSTVTVTELNGTNLATPDVITYGYDADGNLTSEANNNGSSSAGNAMTETLTYNDMNRLATLVEAYGGTDVFSQNFVGTNMVTGAVDLTMGYTPDGQKGGVYEARYNTNGSVLSTTAIQYGYDGLDRLTSNVDTSSFSTQSFGDTYSYDLDGNRISKTQTGSSPETTTNTYNADDQLTQSVDSVSGTTKYTYDANGSLISATNNGTVVASYTYNVQNELVSATVNGVTSSDVYNDSVDRVEETVNGTPTYYLYDDNNPTGYSQVLESKSSPTSAPGVSYILGLDIIGQASSSGVVSYFLTDGQGSTRALVNSSGVVTATFNYDASGNLLGVTYTPSSPPPTVYLYDQQQLDVALGQYQLRARIYNPATGEFDSFDPMTHEPGDVLGANPYIYADDDAPNMDDPTGMGAVFNALLGTAVHSFLNRAFEGFTGIAPGFPNTGGAPGPRRLRGPGTLGIIDRWSNRWISSIARWYRSPGSINRLRPDFVEVSGNTAGDLYELKPLSTFDALAGTSLVMAADLGFYYSALKVSVPTVSWSLGRTWAPGLTVWPTFTSPLKPPGSTLVTIDDYAEFPGAIFYDLVGADDVAEFAAAAASGIASVALTAVTLSSFDAAAGFAAAEAPLAAEAQMADVYGTIGLDMLLEAA